MKIADIQKLVEKAGRLHGSQICAEIQIWDNSMRNPIEFTIWNDNQRKHTHYQSLGDLIAGLRALAGESEQVDEIE
jgi:hypothetical protein